MNNSNTKKIYVGKRVIGEVIRGTFRKHIKGSRHILRTPCSIALSVDSLHQAEQHGAKTIEISDSESGCVYSCSIEHFRYYSFPLQRGGFEPQLALPLERFAVSSPLEISSRVVKRGEVILKPGNGKRIRNPREKSPVSPRQMVFEGML